MFDRDHHQLFTRRTFMLGAIQSTLALTLIGRLYYLQVIKGPHYQLLSDKNRIHAHFLLPPRGKVLDRSGYILADNQNSYASLANPDAIDDPVKLLSQLQKLLKLNDNHVEQLSSQLRKKKRYLSLVIKENLTWEELAVLELHAPDLPGLIIEKGHSRLYPYPHQTCHFIGYVSAVTEKDLDGDTSLELPGMRIGKSGIEKTFEKTLRGTPGVRHVEVNALRKAIRTLDTIESLKGQDLTLTIDFPLQKATYEAIQHVESAAAVVLDVHTGAILAYVSHPGFDANLFINPISKSGWQSIAQNTYKPLINKVIAGQYAPGSTFKMIVALAGLNAGVITPTTHVHCPGHYDFYGNRFHCWNWKNGGHGDMTLQSAIASSCDVFFYYMANQIGVDAIASVARAFGLGQLTGVDIPGEKSGLVPSRSWKRVVRRQTWTAGETINLSIGQGALLTTPLQLARMTAMLVNGLRPITPHFVRSETHITPPPLPYKNEHIELIQKAMSDCVNKPWGTAHLSKLDDPYSMGGKTGSTQVSRITQQQRELNTHNERPYHLREHALFTGFGPVEDPQFAVAVLVEHGGGGAKTAAPIAKNILTAAQKLVTLT